MKKDRCRFCMSKHTLLVDIYKQGQAGFPLELLRESLPNFKAMESRALPKFICFKCLAFVEHMHNFIEMANKSFKVLAPIKRNHRAKQLYGFDPCKLVDFQTSSDEEESGLEPKHSPNKTPSKKRATTKPQTTHFKTPPGKHRVKFCEPGLQERSKLKYCATPMKNILGSNYGSQSRCKVSVIIDSPPPEEGWTPLSGSSSRVKVKVITEVDTKTTETPNQLHFTPVSSSSHETALDRSYCQTCQLTLAKNVNMFQHRMTEHAHDL